MVYIAKLYEAADNLTVREILSSFEKDQHIALVQKDNVLWTGVASNFQHSALYDDFVEATVKGLQFSRNIFSTFLGGVSQNWMGMLIQI